MLLAWLIWQAGETQKNNKKNQPAFEKSVDTYVYKAKLWQNMTVSLVRSKKYVSCSNKRLLRRTCNRVDPWKFWRNLYHGIFFLLPKTENSAPGRVLVVVRVLPAEAPRVHRVVGHARLPLLRTEAARGQRLLRRRRGLLRRRHLHDRRHLPARNIQEEVREGECLFYKKICVG